MRSTTTITSGSSRWITVDSMQPPFGVGLGVSIAYGSSTPNWTVQHTFDPTDGPTHPVTIACAASATVQVTDTAHGLQAGDSVTITGSSNSLINGTFDVATVVDANTYTYTTTSTTYNGPAQCASMRVYPHAVLVSQTSTRADGNYAFPIYACRIKLNSGSGTVSFTVMQGTGV